MDYIFIIKKIRELVTTDPELFSKIETRFYPRKLNIGDEQLVYPLISFVVSGGVPDTDNYPTDVIFTEFYFVSDSSIDESFSMYSRFMSLVNNTTFKKDDGTFNFCMYEDTKCMDISALYNGKLLYIASNTMVARTIAK